MADAVDHPITRSPRATRDRRARRPVACAGRLGASCSREGGRLGAIGRRRRPSQHKNEVNQNFATFQGGCDVVPLCVRRHGERHSCYPRARRASTGLAQPLDRGRQHGERRQRRRYRCAHRARSGVEADRPVLRDREPHWRRRDDRIPPRPPRPIRTATPSCC